MSAHAPQPRQHHQPAYSSSCRQWPRHESAEVAARSSQVLVLTACCMWCSWLAFGRVCWDADFLQVYCMLTLIACLLCFGLGTKKPGEKSAYSVFNKGMGSLAGTFGAGDFERSLRSQERAQKDFTEVFSSDDDGDEVGTLKTIGRRKKAQRKVALHTGGHTLGGGDDNTGR